jgi:hypothetical protein
VLVELLLFELLLASFALFVAGSAGAGASCTLDADAAEDAAAEADEPACGWLALCAAALFCWSMLCCKVCENGLAFAAAAMAALVEELPAEPSSEPICERSDIRNPVNSSNGVVSQTRRSSSGQTPSARMRRIRAACSSASR